MSTYERVAGLPLEIEEYALEGLSRTVSSGFERLTTVIRLRGGGEEGVGEDVTYAADDHRRQQEHGPVLPMAGRWTFGEFSQRLGELDTFPAAAPKFPVYRNYRRWGFESAALDLRRVLPTAGRARHLPGRRAEVPGLPQLPALGVRECRARPRAAPGGPLGRRHGRA